MKFKKLHLDESLFAEDDSFDWDIDSISTTVDDVLEGPTEGADVGVADLLISAINNAWDTIKKNNSLIATLKVENGYDSFITVIDKINSDVNEHIGQLQGLLKTISPNAEMISVGQQNTSLEFQAGKLRVQSWNAPVTEAAPQTLNSVENVCTLDNVDDEM